MTKNQSGSQSGMGSESGMGDTARRAAEDLKETGREALQGAKSVMDSAMSDLKSASTAKAEEMRGTIAEEGQRMADSLREAAQQGGGVQAKVLETMANGVSAVSDQIAQHDLRSLMDDVTSFARRNPAVFVAGAAVAGLMLARMAAQAGRTAGDEGGMPSGYGRGGMQAGDMGAGLQGGGMGGTSTGSGLSDRMERGTGGGMTDDPTPGPTPGSSDLDPASRGPSMGGNL
jgi:hypothetical protein